MAIIKKNTIIGIKESMWELELSSLGSERESGAAVLEDSLTFSQKKALELSWKAFKM